MRVYVAAPYGSAGRVRDVHALLATIGCTPCSHWAELATEAETLTDATARVHLAQWEINMQGLEMAEALLVLSEDVGGGEMFAEVGRAITLGRPVLWTGPRRVLSCYAPGVVVASSLEKALDRLASAAKVPREARTQVLLAGFKGARCPRCQCADLRSTSFADRSPAWNCTRCDAMFVRLQAVAS